MLVPNVTHSLRRLGIIGGALVVAASVAGCGGLKRFNNPNLETGKVLFVEKCGACHTLAHAGTRGTVGPNLDDAFAEAVANGLGRSTIEGIVHDQVLNPNPNGVMPKGLLSGSDLNDVAAYVSQVAAAPGQDTGLLAQVLHKPGNGPPAVEKNGVLAFAADPTGQLSYTTRKAVATAGPVTITMTNMSGVAHNLAIQAGDSGATQGATPVLGSTPISASKATSSFRVNLKPGTYTYFCQAPGHRMAGMWGTIVVK